MTSAPTLAALAALSLAAGDGPSFDCAKARAPDEWLVCSEPRLAAIDRELAAKYGARVRTAGPAAAAELRRTQQAWLEERASCTRGRGGAPAPPREASVRCLETSYGWRISDLEPAQASQLPAGIVERRILRRDPLARDLVDVGFPALAPGRPGAAAFDGFFARMAQSMVDKRSAAGGKEDLDDPFLPETSLTVGFSVPLSTARLVTVVMGGDDYGGGAHGMPFAVATTFDLERGRPLALEDVFARGPEVADDLLVAALRRLGPEVEDWDGAEENARQTLASASSWTFLADGAVVTFPPYAVGPFVIGMPEVRFTWAELRRHLRAGSPLPPPPPPPPR